MDAKQKLEMDSFELMKRIGRKVLEENLLETTNPQVTLTPDDRSPSSTVGAIGIQQSFTGSIPQDKWASAFDELNYLRDQGLIEFDPNAPGPNDTIIVTEKGKYWIQKNREALRN